VLVTRFVGHSVIASIRKARLVYPGVIDTGQIKDILESCKDVLVIPSPAVDAVRKDVPVEPDGQAPLEPEVDLAVLDFLTTPRRKEMTEMDKLAAAILALTQANGGKVGKMHLAKIIKDTCPDTTSAKLVRDGWVVPVANEGHKVGSYMPSEKLLATVKQEQHEPDDPYARAKFLIAQKPEILAERHALEEKAAEIRKRLERIEIAEEVLERLSAL
ncbi:MAG: hypothetical protein WA053_02535, partial [Minisyncoccia bacterium]